MKKPVMPGDIMDFKLWIKRLDRFHRPAVIGTCLDKNVNILGRSGPAGPATDAVSPGQNERNLLLDQGSQDLHKRSGRGCHWTFPKSPISIREAYGFVDCRTMTKDWAGPPSWLPSADRYGDRGNLVIAELTSWRASERIQATIAVGAFATRVWLAGRSCGMVAALQAAFFYCAVYPGRRRVRLALG